MPYNLSLTVCTQRNFIADVLQVKCKLPPPPVGAYRQHTMFILGSLESTYWTNTYYMQLHCNKLLDFKAQNDRTLL